MAATVLCIFRFVRLLLSAHQAVALENAALRMQIVAYPREKSRPKLTDPDRLFWTALRQSGRTGIVPCSMSSPIPSYVGAQCPSDHEIPKP